MRYSFTEIIIAFNDFLWFVSVGIIYNEVIKFQTNLGRHSVYRGGAAGNYFSDFAGGGRGRCRVGRGRCGRRGGHSRRVDVGDDGVENNAQGLRSVDVAAQVKYLSKWDL